MKSYVIATGTVTYAVKGKELLRRKGFNAEIERMKYGTEKYGCGYGITVSGDISYIEDLLRSNNVKVLKIIPRN